jgi:hypothetical protein
MLAPDFWGLNQDAFERKVNGLQFYWVSKDRASARSQARGLTFGNQPVVEVIVRFASNTVSEALLSFFNRGDVGGIGEAEFSGKLTAVSNLLGKISRTAGRDISRREDLATDRKMQTLVWLTSNVEYRLEAAWTKLKNQPAIQPEFVNLTLKARRGPVIYGPTPEPSARAGLLALRQKIKRTPGGDVFLDGVPMVDQGQKGYCAVATTERVMRYYGLDINMHEVAQKANTTTGTDSKSLLTALKAMANAADLQLKVVDKFDVEDILREVRDYNQEAKRQKLPEITLPKSGMIDVAAVYRQMDKGVFLKSRGKVGNQQARFVGNVQEKINSGYPVFWGVTLGFVDESIRLPQGIGGHMRLIIGYNNQTKEIIYTDSWGPGHEMKRMSQPNAYAITTCLYSMEP